jgi:GNAT superfamily N-acetyltransferase
MVSLRRALEGDVRALIAFDRIASESEAQSTLICRAVASGTCHVADLDGQIVAYGILNYNFYGHGWVDMLYTHAGHRRLGVGSTLLRHMEALCETPKLFTSTNLSNLPMQSLLSRAGFVLSGIIENLDEGDPEIVYFKRVK